jgi:hypothetical protein
MLLAEGLAQVPRCASMGLTVWHNVIPTLGQQHNTMTLLQNANYSILHALKADCYKLT